MLLSALEPQFPWSEDNSDTSLTGWSIALGLLFLLVLASPSFSCIFHLPSPPALLLLSFPPSLALLLLFSGANLQMFRL